MAATGQIEAAPALTSGARRLAANALSLLASDTANRATTLVLYVLVARHLGAHAFGQLSLALALFYTFQVLAAAGLKTLTVREVARDRARTARYIADASAVVIAASTVAIGLLAGFVNLMGYARDTSAVILLLGLALLPFALTAVCEGAFQAWERMHYIAIANLPANVLKVVIAWLLLSSGHSLVALIGLIVAGHVLVLLTGWFLLVRYIVRPVFNVDLGHAWRLARATSTFLGIDAIIAVMASSNILLLSVMATETMVGHYNAGGQLMVPLMLVFQSVVLSVFPLMCRRFEANLDGLRRLSERLIEVLLIVALPTVVGIYFLAGDAILLIYGDQSLLPAARALQIMIWALALTALTSVLGQALIAGLRERVTLRIVAIDALAGLILGIVLISQFGVAGAALAMLLTKVVDFTLHYVLARRMMPSIDLLSAAWRPLVATAVMGIWLVVLGDEPMLTTALSAAAVYAVVLALLMVAAVGGPSRLRARYLYLWSD